MVKAGDSVEVSSRKVGQAARRGVVTDVSGNMLRVRWENGERTTFVPTAGALTVLSDTAPDPSPRG